VLLLPEAKGAPSALLVLLLRPSAFAVVDGAKFAKIDTFAKLFLGSLIVSKCIGSVMEGLPRFFILVMGLIAFTFVETKEFASEVIWVAAPFSKCMESALGGLRRFFFLIVSLSIFSFVVGRNATAAAEALSMSGRPAVFFFPAIFFIEAAVGALAEWLVVLPIIFCFFFGGSLSCSSLGFFFWTFDALFDPFVADA
jgi:hypothetical protein